MLVRSHAKNLNLISNQKEYDRAENFLLIKNQMEYRLNRKQKKTCHHDYIPFNLKLN